MHLSLWQEQLHNTWGNKYAGEYTWSHTYLFHVMLRPRGLGANWAKVQIRMILLEVDQGLSKHQNISSTPVRKVIFFLCGDFTPFISKTVQI